MPSMLDSSVNIKSGDACFSEKGKQIVKALSGDGPRDEKVLGKGVYKRYGIGKHGFNIVSNQFSIHYFFKDRVTFYNFIRNKMISGGIIIFDDFGIWGVDGIKKFIYKIENRYNKDFYFFKNYMGQCILIKK